MLGLGDTAADILGLTPEDVLVLFSFPPYASQTLQILDAARKRGVVTIGITDPPISPLGKVDVTLTARVLASARRIRWSRR